MSFLSIRRPFHPPLFAALSTAPLMALAGEALAHDTGAPHGTVEHLALFASVAAFLAVAGAVAALSTRGKAARRIRVERDDPRRQQTRR